MYYQFRQDMSKRKETTKGKKPRQKSKAESRKAKEEEPDTCSPDTLVQYYKGMVDAVQLVLSGNISPQHFPTALNHYRSQVLQSLGTTPQGIVDGTKRHADDPRVKKQLEEYHQVVDSIGIRALLEIPDRPADFTDAKAKQVCLEYASMMNDVFTELKAEGPNPSPEVLERANAQMSERKKALFAKAKINESVFQFVLPQLLSDPEFAAEFQKINPMLMGGPDGGDDDY
eukprot:TRINITY_DN1661_c0_g1_i3.p1 TRINITY_DN1661_c0_g1~~TRINITY_DN1661_c0_g1_i3.p1  ORF type:complete len:229 (+),score=32.69 TRINITY_DN1661_c0_g1_i3:107-793(+)